METMGTYKQNLEEQNHEIRTDVHEEIVIAPQQDSVMNINMAEIEDLPAGNILLEQTPATEAMEYAGKVRVNQRSRNRSDSYRMRQVKQNIDRYMNLCGRMINFGTDFDALKAGAVDIIRELVRVCEEYVGARTGGLDDPNSRHGMVNMLLKNARKSLTQIAGMSEADFQLLFRDKKREISFADLMREDYSRRDINSADAKKLCVKAKEDAYRRDHSALDKQLELFPKQKHLISALSKYINLQKSDIPDKADEFDQKRSELRNLCEDIYRTLLRISKEGATLESNKVRRERACRLLELFAWERRKLEASKFSTLKQNGILTFDGIWQGEDRMIRYEDATEEMVKSFRYLDSKAEARDSFRIKKKVRYDNKKVRYVPTDEYPVEFNGIFGSNARQNCKNTEKMARMLNIGGLFSKVKDITLVDYKEQRIEEERETKDNNGNIVKKTHVRYEEGYSKGFYQESKGITFSKAMETARSENMNLIYTEAAIRDVTSILVMDMICGQVNRTEESLLVNVSKGNKQGENCYLITGVMATNNEYSFSTAKFADINKNAVNSSLRAISYNDRSLLFKVYDINLADRIMNVKMDDLEREFSDLKGERLDALKERFGEVQKIFMQDKKNPKSERSKLEAKLSSTQDPSEREKYIKEYMYVYRTQYDNMPNVTYMDKALLKDVGNNWEVTKKLDNNQKNVNAFNDGFLDVDEANEDVEEKLNSVRLMKQKRQNIRARYNADTSGLMDKGEKRSPEFVEIMNLVSDYVNFDITTQKAYNLDFYSVRNNVSEEYKDKNIDKDFLKKISGLNNNNAYPLLESWMVANIKRKIDVRKNAILTVSEENRSELLKKELTDLTVYWDFFSDTDGQLGIDSIREIKPKYDELNFGLLDAQNMPIDDNHLRDCKDELLFPHEPCIQDVFQGDVGDCYFISTIAAIVDRNPAYIKTMMRDDGKGHVYVRLYDKGKQVYIKVKKTVAVNDTGNDRYAHGPLWVKMLEKAFVISGLHVKNRETPHKSQTADFKRFDRDRKRSYSCITSGTRQEALMTLIGSSEKTLPIDEELAKNYPKLHVEYDHRVLLSDGTLTYAGDLEKAAENLKNKLINYQNSKKVVAFGTRGIFTQSSMDVADRAEEMQQGLSAGHAYTFVGVEEKNGIFYARLKDPNGWTVESFRNPLSGRIGYRRSHLRLGTFCVDMKTLVIHMKNLSVATVPGA